MSGYSKVIWSEGMFLRPQHFQQQERYVENFINNRCVGLQPYSWGFYHLNVDTDLLKIGKLALSACSGILPDGTPFNLPADDDLPLPLDLDGNSRNELVYLALPLRLPEAPEINHSSNGGGLARFQPYEKQIRDACNFAEAKAQIMVGKLRTRLMKQAEDRSGYTCISIARVIEVRADKVIILDEQFIPPNMNCSDENRLRSFLKELHGLLNTRSEALAGRVTDSGQGGVAEYAGFLMLQMINRYLPLLAHLANVAGLHPEVFYRYGIQMAGEFATFFRVDKRPVNFSVYNHEDLQATFAPLMDELRHMLGMSIDPPAVPLPLAGPKYGGLYAARNTDISLLERAAFVLAARADMPSENLRREFPRQTIIGPIEDIRQHISSLTPGITIHPLSVAPRQIPYHAGFVYFELDKHGDIWKKMASSGGFAIHIGGNYPGLKLEFWAIKEG